MMIRMRQTGIFAAALLLMLSCTREDPVREVSSITAPLRFSISSAQMTVATKGLVNGSSELETACTPIASGGGGEAVGIWADSKVAGAVRKNVFPGTNLIYAPGRHGGHTGEDAHLNNWNYNGVDLFWSSQGEYKFRAYYPFSVISEGIDMSAASATTFVLDYQAAREQSDLMVGYAYVDASVVGAVGQHVQLDMKHALAALRFKFEYAPDYLHAEEDHITSFWLENTASNSHFISGQLRYYGIDDDADGVDEVEEQRMSWSAIYTPPSGEVLYRWAASPGPGISRTSDSVSTSAYAYEADGTTAGAVYTGNDNYLLIIPQALGKTRLNFTTYEGGETVFHADIPQTLSIASAPDRTPTDRYLPGYRYDYTIQISKTDLEVTLTIAPWEVLQSSYSIDF